MIVKKLCVCIHQYREGERGERERMGGNERQLKYIGQAHPMLMENPEAQGPVDVMRSIASFISERTKIGRR